MQSISFTKVCTACLHSAYIECQLSHFIYNFDTHINNRGVSDMGGVIILFGGCRTSTPAVCRDSLPDTRGTNLAWQGWMAFTACLYLMNGAYQKPVLWWSGGYKVSEFI